MDAALMDQLTDTDLAAASRGATSLRGLIEDLSMTGQTLTIAQGSHTYIFTIEELDSLAKVVETVADSRADEDTEITPNDAATILRMSRPSVIRLVEKGVLGARMVNTHRRLSRNEVIAYRDRQAMARRQALDNLSNLSEEYDF